MSTLKASNLQHPSAASANITLASDGTIGGACLTQTCRAWVNFNGTGTVAIRASYNVSSITDNGIGSYTVNFTTALTDANYSVCGSSNYSAGWTFMNNTLTTSSVSINSVNGNTGSGADTSIACVAIFR